MPSLKALLAEQSQLTDSIDRALETLTSSRDPLSRHLAQVELDQCTARLAELDDAFSLKR